VVVAMATMWYMISSREILRKSRNPASKVKLKAKTPTVARQPQKNVVVVVIFIIVIRYGYRFSNAIQKLANCYFYNLIETPTSQKVPEANGKSQTKDKSSRLRAKNYANTNEIQSNQDTSEN